jgi:transcriptional regulator with XRE-family HTH domain
MPRRRSVIVTGIDFQIGRQIARRRLLLGLKQQQLAEMLGLSFQQLQKYESGFNRVSASRLYQLAQVLRVPITWFYEDIDCNARKPKSWEPAEPSHVSDRELVQFVRAYHRIKDASTRFYLRGVLAALAGEK